jgi:hypothetical protein
MLLYSLAKILFLAGTLLFVTFTMDHKRGYFSNRSSFCALLFLAWLYVQALTAKTQVTRLANTASLAFIFMRFIDIYWLNSRKWPESFWGLCRSFTMIPLLQDHDYETLVRFSKTWQGLGQPFRWLGCSPRLTVTLAVVVEGALQIQFGKLLYANNYVNFKERVNVYEWPPYSLLWPGEGFVDRIAFSLCFAMLLYIFINTILKALLPVSLILNGVYKGSFDRIWLSLSVQEFWRDRWNLTFQEAFYRIIGKTVRNRRKNSRVAILILTFLYSGLMHDWIIWNGMSIKASSRTFEMTCFFMAQVLGILLEMCIIPRNGLLARFWTYSWLLFTSPLFIRPFLVTTNAQPDPLSIILG